MVMQIIQGLEKKKNSALNFFKNHTNPPTNQQKANQPNK